MELRIREQVSHYGTAATRTEDLVAAIVGSRAARQLRKQFTVAAMGNLPISITEWRSARFPGARL